ncbi:hypothetical protein QQX98_008039 [Neonectria punicea]|uniref:Cullin family profile domain-containing protein n=1 Tax=Neonectria punicea TaxID=979145 RepID=A0ABR1GWA8_9HYPO
MKLFNLLLALPLLALSNIAVASTYEEALDAIYAYVLYDFDASVWGDGQGYVGAGCEGTFRSNKRCTLNEFINFIQFGEASENPTYFDLPADFYLAAGTLTQIADVFLQKIVTWEKIWGRIVPGRTSEQGLRHDMAHTLQLTLDKAKALGLRYEHRLKDLNIVMDMIVKHSRARVHTNIIKHLGSTVKEVILETVDVNEKLLSGEKWPEIQWERMLESYPALKDPNSGLSKKVVQSLEDFYSFDTGKYSAEKLRRTGEVARSCLRLS